ncbi:MAG: CapA family protein, partial [Rhodospirillaceae bacterium]
MRLCAIGFRFRAKLCCLTFGLLSGFALAADHDTQSAWAERLAQLGQPADGDIVLTAIGDAIWTQTLSEKDDAALQAVFEVLRASDISYMNFEQAMTDEGFPMPAKDIVRADTSIIDEFVWAGVDIVSTANNHAMDYDAAGLKTTVAT